MNNFDDYLEHHGIKGQKWGVRNYQNEDGTLTSEGRKRYNQNSSSIGTKMKNAANKSGAFIKKQVMNKINARKGKNPATGLTDSELDERLKRMRKEAEYSRLQREIQGKNQGEGKKGDKKHPLLSKALTMPVATAIGVGVAAIATEKVASFLDHRAATKMSTFMKAAKTSTSEAKLGKIFETARRAADTAKHPVRGIPDISSLVGSNKDKSVASLVIKESKNVSNFVRRTSLDNPVMYRRGRTFSGW